ncbi:hypothetical protein MHYP_G00165690 [Metynnis hypsauchen]
MQSRGTPEAELRNTSLTCLGSDVGQLFHRFGILRRAVCSFNFTDYTIYVIDLTCATEISDNAITNKIIRLAVGGAVCQQYTPISERLQRGLANHRAPGRSSPPLHQDSDPKKILACL